MQLPVLRDDLVEAITYAIWRSFRFTPKKAERMEEARRLARAVVEHLEMSGIRCERRELGRGHSTP